jgi:hypothetical protein
MAIDPKVRLQNQRLSPQMPQVGMPVRPNPQGGVPLPQNMRGGVGMGPMASMPQRPMPPGAMPPRPMPMSPYQAMKKGGEVCYAGGGKTEEKKDPPIPAETIASMKRQAAQEKADRKQAEEQKAGEKEVRDNMGRIGFKNGGSIKASKMGAVKTAKPTMRSASSRADGIAIRGKTRA